MFTVMTTNQQKKNESKTRQISEDEKTDTRKEKKNKQTTFGLPKEAIKKYSNKNHNQMRSESKRITHLIIKPKIKQSKYSSF